MKKYIEASELLSIFRDDEMLSCDRPFDVYQWAENIIDECPPAQNVISIPFPIGTKVYTLDGRSGTVQTFYVGKTGIQRIFVLLSDGEQINFTMKGIGKDIFINNPAERDSCASEAPKTE